MGVVRALLFWLTSGVAVALAVRQAAVVTENGNLVLESPTNVLFRIDDEADASLTNLMADLSGAISSQASLHTRLQSLETAILTVSSTRRMLWSAVRDGFPVVALMMGCGVGQRPLASLPWKASRTAWWRKWTRPRAPSNA
jgi:hypothetical protein